MKRSVVIIAHNEESRIGACIESVLKQTLSADEIIVIAHNCTDTTAAVAKEFSDARMRVDEYNGPAGIVAARLRGIGHASGDRIFCVDGDARAKENWIFELDQMISCDKKPVLVGSFVNVKGPLFWKIFTPINRHFIMRTSHTPGVIWGASFAFPSHQKEHVLSYLNESREISGQLGLIRNPDDYWMALRMQGHGNLCVTNTTEVFVEWKQNTNKECIERNRQDVGNGKKMRGFYGQEFKDK